ncbi:MAG: hypothetical protein O7A68_00005 [Alphaproteobacteria bacterium]|nr:hypothetical protein [Alphaproteobacteria bacterium]
MLRRVEGLEGHAEPELEVRRERFAIGAAGAPSAAVHDLADLVEGALVIDRLDASGHGVAGLGR